MAARAAETLMSLRYGLPTGDEVFTSLDTLDGGRQLLVEQGLSFGHPHFTAVTTPECCASSPVSRDFDCPYINIRCPSFHVCWLCTDAGRGAMSPL